MGQKMAEKPRTYEREVIRKLAQKHDQYEVKEDLAKMHRGDDVRYASMVQQKPCNYSRNEVKAISRDFRKSIRHCPNDGVLTKPFNRLGGRNAAEVEAEMKAVHSSKQEERRSLP